METDKMMNAHGANRIWFRCMEKRVDCEGLLAVSGWHEMPEDAWRAAAENDMEMKPVVEEHLARGDLNQDKAIRVNERVWQLTWNRRKAKTSNGGTDLPPAEPRDESSKRN